MRIVFAEEWNGNRESLERAVQEFKQAKDAHKFTVGVPAPMADQIVEELAARDVPFSLAAELPIDPPAAELETPEFDQIMTDRWVMNRLALQLASEADAPEYVKRHAARVGG